MAVTISVSDVASAIRAGDSESETADITRLVAVATAVVERHTPLAPDVLHNEAVRLIVGYWFDAPNTWRYTAFAGVFRNCGARALLADYRPLASSIVGEVKKATVDIRWTDDVDIVWTKGIDIVWGELDLFWGNNDLVWGTE